VGFRTGISLNLKMNEVDLGAEAICQKQGQVLPKRLLRTGAQANTLCSQ